MFFYLGFNQPDVVGCTAIFKCTNEPPVGDGFAFLTYEELPSDFYLWLAGQAGRLLRDEIPFTESIPERRSKPALKK